MITHITLTNVGPHERLELTGLQPITLFVGHPNDGLYDVLGDIKRIYANDTFFSRMESLPGYHRPDTAHRIHRANNGLKFNSHLCIPDIDFGYHYTELYDMWQRVFDMVVTDGKPNGKQVFASTQNHECFEALILVMRDRYKDVYSAPVCMVRIEAGGVSIARAEIMDTAYRMGIEYRGITPKYPNFQTHLKQR